MADYLYTIAKEINLFQNNMAYIMFLWINVYSLYVYPMTVFSYYLFNTSEMGKKYLCNICATMLKLVVKEIDYIKK